MNKLITVAIMLLALCVFPTLSKAQQNVIAQPIFINQSAPPNTIQQAYTPTSGHNFSLCYYITGTTVNGTLQYQLGADMGSKISWTTATVITTQTSSNSSMHCQPINYGEYVNIQYVAGPTGSSDVILNAVLLKQE